MPSLSTIRQIEAAAQQAERAIGALQRKLQAEQRQIRRKAFLENRALSPQEKQRLADVAAAQQGLADALIALSSVTFQNLANWWQVPALERGIFRINPGLKGDLDKLMRYEAFAATAAKVADTIARVAAKADVLAAEAEGGGSQRWP